MLPFLMTDYSGIGLMVGAICAGLATLISAIGARSTSRENSRKLDAVGEKQDLAVGKAEETHALVNSNLQAVRQQLAAAIACVIALTAFILWSAQKGKPA